MNARHKKRAQKLFAVFVSDGATEGEADSAYEGVCRLGAKLEDVARRIDGSRWVTLYGDREFEMTPDLALLLETRHD